MKNRFGYWVAPLALAMACGGGQQEATEPVQQPVETADQTPPEETPPAETPAETKPVEKPAPAPLTAEQKLAVFRGFTKALVSKDAAATGAALADNVAWDQIDGNPTTGRDAVLENMTGFWTAMPDMTGANVLVLGNGSTVAAVFMARGKMTGDMGAMMKATNNEFGELCAMIGTVGDDGKITAVKEYFDYGAFMAQLTAAKQPHRAPMAMPAAEPVVAMAADNDAEKANVDTLKAGYDAWNKHDYKAFAGYMADDLVWTEMSMPADITGKNKVLPFHKELWGAFKDAKIEVNNIWGAGDYVVVEATFTGTNTGAFKSMGLKKATKKPVTLHELHVMQLEGGKVKHFWGFFDSMVMGMQLGLIPTPAAPAAPPSK